MHKYPKPFATGALGLMELGMAVIPLGGPDGKTPAGVARFNHWKRPPGRAVVEKWTEEQPAANVGVVAYPSKITVVDVDGDEALLKEMVVTFGEARVVVSSPNGFHLYYRSSGETCGDLRRQGMTVDIKGIGGLIVAPPSHNFRTGRAYEFLYGTQQQLSSLTPMRAHSLAPRPDFRGMKLGERNNTLFRLGLYAASRAGSLEELTDQLIIANSVANPPLSISEVKKTAASAWRYHLEGRNFAGRRGLATVPGWLQEALAAYPGGLEALWLYVLLLRNHLVRGAAATFAIAPKAFVFSNILPFSEHRIRRAIRLLIDVGVLKRITSGGRGANDPALYALADATKEGVVMSKQPRARLKKVN